MASYVSIKCTQCGTKTSRVFSADKGYGRCTKCDAELKKPESRLNIKLARARAEIIELERQELEQKYG